MLMSILFIVLGSVISFIIGAGATHGYAKHRWPVKMVARRDYYGGRFDADENSDKRLFSTILWPGYWIFVWPFTKVNEVTFSNIEKSAAKQVAKNKARVADLQATRAQLEESNTELEQAEVELEKEINKL